MKRFFIIFISVVLSVILCSCEGKTKIKPEIVGKSFSSHISSVKTYNKTGKIQREDFYSYDEAGLAKVYATVNYVYNDSGRLISAKKMTEGNEYGQMLENFVYSGDNWTQRIVYDELGSAAEVYNRTYYPKGELKAEQTVISYRDGKNLAKKDETCTYREDGVLLEKISVEGNIYTRHEYVYDEETGRVITENIYNSNSGKKKDYMLFNIIRNTYDEETNLLIRSVETGLGDNVISVTSFTYDEQGNPTYIAVYSDETMDDDAFVSSKIYEYDEAGRCTLSADMNTDGSGWKTSYEYDSSGNVVYESQLTFYGDSETRTSTIETEYDSHNNPLRETEKAFDGKITVRTWSYEYYESGAKKTETRYADA